MERTEILTASPLRLTSLSHLIVRSHCVFRSTRVGAVAAVRLSALPLGAAVSAGPASRPIALRPAQPPTLAATCGPGNRGRETRERGATEKAKLEEGTEGRGRER